MTAGRAVNGRPSDHSGGAGKVKRHAAKACSQAPADAKASTQITEAATNGKASHTADWKDVSAQASGPLSMFGHMFQQQPSLADLRRRAVTLVDVVTERHQNGRLHKHRILAAFAVSLLYWYFLLPACRDWGTQRWQQAGDDQPGRAGGPWAEVDWRAAAYITAAYLLITLAGSIAMRSRAPVRKRVFEWMFMYNATQVMLNAILAFNLWLEAWRLGFQPWGNLMDTTPGGHRLGMMLWFQYHCRQLELLDTVFLVLRKKIHSMPTLHVFLHIYLRLVHMWGWYFACRHACGGDSYFPAAVNATCQVVVYLYYSTSLLREQGLPLMRRARVTEVQVAQFVLCATHSTYVLTFGNLPRAVAAASLAVMASGLLLYVEWDGRNTQFGPRSSIEISMFGHMFEGQQFLVDQRRRALSLIDVVVESQGNGPLRPHRLLSAFGVSLLYWYFVLPAMRDWGTVLWYQQDPANSAGFARAGGPWADVRASSAILVSIMYLSVVFMGVRVMESRPPVKKRIFEYMFIYNLTQVMLNASLSFTLWREASHLGYLRQLWGNPLDTSPTGHRLGMLLWFQYHCRQLELLDTIFVILRKKFHHMSFLHILLRLVHMWGWFVVCRYACGGDSYFPAAVNATCQVIVYLYYTVSMIYERGVPLVRKARVTEVQVAQFVLCGVHACFVLYCGNLPRAVAALSLFVMNLSVVFYVDFTSKNPRVGSQRPPEQDQGRLTFRFDSSGWFYVYHFGVALFIEEHLLPDVKAANWDEQYPKDIAFAGSSGGALVAGALASGIDIRALFEFVLEQHGDCQMKPWRIFGAVEKAMQKFVPKNAATTFTGRVRILMTRIGMRPPFITGDVVDQFDTWDDVYGVLRASCHVPGLQLLPYTHRGRHYYDGLIWSSLLVPWSGDDKDLCVKVSAWSAPLSDIRAKPSPPWWILIPPSKAVLRGIFWSGYRDAARWFAEPPSEAMLCGCRAAPGRMRKRGSSDFGSRSPTPSPPSSPAGGAEAQQRPGTPGGRARVGSTGLSPTSPDPTGSRRAAKHAMGQRMLLRRPRPLSEIMPEKDPTTGQSVQDLLDCYRRSLDNNFRAMWWVGGVLACSTVLAGLAAVHAGIA